ncbi:peptidoglycan meso-diaminopimelic acid protein amidase [Rosenbergiella australiborealis]|uniref:Murein L,D-transpeptidase n=1 Tax=Rosenbergiella australiborealis TaxID=1544696 RepID=A0ABS5T9I8_9GAMM|nr:peptidoglycan meso-diaminopimelic acid protein amidase [Rosenbergiella australiborealis]MBT0728388.1 murein L,D-transpeptidase [Rosenbergiella australiborealis]
MRIFALVFAILFSCSAFSENVVPLSNALQAPVSNQLKTELLGSPVFIQIFKSERVLELYAKVGNQFRLLDRFSICKFSGGLGPKRTEGDFKSPEGFYTIGASQLHPDSHYYRAINLGFPNQYDRDNGYHGNYLMIHGDCVSIGCYAMTNSGIAQIFNYVTAAFHNGQSQIEVNIYPFRMTDDNMRLYAGSQYINFWKQLKPGYDYFEKYKLPPTVIVTNNQYIVNGQSNGTVAPKDNLFRATSPSASKTFLAFTQTE